MRSKRERLEIMRRIVLDAEARWKAETSGDAERLRMNQLLGQLGFDLEDEGLAIVDREAVDDADL